MLAHVGVKFEEKTYNMGPNFERNEFHDIKSTLGLDFPNLPYYIDGDVKLSQSVAILRYIALQHGLDGVTNEEKARIYLIEQQLVDYRIAGTNLFYSAKFNTLDAAYRERLPAKLKTLADFLGDRKWLSGDKLSYGDFLAHEYFNTHKLFEPGCLDSFPNLGHFVTQFEALPNVEKYMKSDKFIKWPINNDMAKWGQRSQPYPGQ
ncbi:Glutathione S-transferase Mu 5 [Halotydeus destructor]|nr:Glutathione S-transferase Mu 5 [Halotydeus destructor]